MRSDGTIATFPGGSREELDTPHDVAVARDGSLRVAIDRVWRLAPDGALTAVAGDGRDVSDGDGGPAVVAGVSQPHAVEVMPDGSVFIAQGDGRLRHVGRDGTINTVPGSFGLSALAVGPGGRLLGAATDFAIDSQPPEGSRVYRIDAGGRKTRLAGGGRRPGFDGDGGDPTQTGIFGRDISVAADGGLHIADVNTIRYLPPERPRLLAVAITRRTLTTSRRLRVSFATTLRARVTVRVACRKVVHGARPGETVVALGPRLARSGARVIRVLARSSSGQVATDRQVIFPGGRLVLRDARWLARTAGVSWTDLIFRATPRRVGTLPPHQPCSH